MMRDDDAAAWHEPRLKVRVTRTRNKSRLTLLVKLLRLLLTYLNLVVLLWLRELRVCPVLLLLLVQGQRT